MSVCTSWTSRDRFLAPGPSPGCCVAGLKIANQSAPSFFSSGGTVCGSTLRSTGMGAMPPEDEGGGGNAATAFESCSRPADEEAVGVGGYGWGPK